jgi:hypothetical protein
MSTHGRHTAANNATSDTLINWQDGQARATVNNSARSRTEMAAIAKFRQSDHRLDHHGFHCVLAPRRQ